jgi:hypothetical protein
MDMRISTLIQRSVLVAALAAVSCVIAGTAQAAAGHAAPAQCATVTVKPTPKLNTDMIPETIKSTVTSCATATETVTLSQQITLQGTGSTLRAKTWTITLAPGQTVTKTRSYPYTCCGSYVATDHVLGSSGQLLAKASSGFTFA